MLIAESRREYARAREAGRSARRDDRKLSANIYRGSSALLRDLHDEWAIGWREADAEIRAKR